MPKAILSEEKHETLRTLEMRITVNGVETIQIYGFRLNENGERIFLPLA